MTVTVIKKDGEKIVYKNAYEVHQQGRHTKYIVVVYMVYRRDELDSVNITFES